MRLSFKLRRASRTGGTLAHKKLNHPFLLSKMVGGGGKNTSVNTIVRVDGLLGQDKVQFVLDSGAALSLVRYDAVNPAYLQNIQKEEAIAPIGANSQSLHVMGRVNLPIKLGEHCLLGDDFLGEHCLLGADFLI